MSPDGKEWKDHSVQQNFLGDVAFGNELFVAVGYQRAMTSKNGAEWSSPIPLRDASWRRIEFGNGRFVAVGRPSSKDPESGCVAASSDGAKWTSNLVAGKVQPSDIAFGKAVFVMVGDHGMRETSKDGVAWENRTLGDNDESLTSVAWTGSEFLTSGNKGAYASPDGVKWTKTAMKLPSRFAIGDGVFAGCGAGKMSYSKDGKTWAPAKADGTLQITRIIYIPMP